MDADLVAVARVVKTRGVRGEVVADVLTDFPERFDDMETLTALAPTGRVSVLEIEDFWWQNERLVLKFAGYDTPEQSRELVGCELAVHEAECVELEEDEFYDWQLAGCRVETVAGEQLGRVRGVLRYGPNEVLAVVCEATQREYLIPFVAAICVEVKIGEGLIKVDPPEGMLEF